MNQAKKIIILGTGGTSVDILDIINDINEKTEERFECVGFLDDDKEKIGKSINGIKIIGSLKKAKEYKNAFFVNGIGNPSNFLRKEEIIRKTFIPINKFLTIIHPSASVSKTSKVGKGSVIFQNVTINSNVKIGNHVVILSNSAICHDSIIGDYGCVASSVSISGNVKIGKSCYMGSNSSIKEGIKIGHYSLIGIGSVVLENISNNVIFAGNPAKLLRKI